MTNNSAINTALTTINGVRLTYEDKWLVFEDGLYSVYQRSYGQRKTRTLIETEWEQIATDVLIGNRRPTDDNR